MRIRSIKPEFWGSQSVGRLSRDSRLAFIGLWSCADDQGRFRADPRYLAGQLFPYDADAITVVETALADLVREGSITLYKVGPDAYGVCNGWKDHQRIDKPSKAKLPAPEEGQPLEVRLPEDSGSTPGGLREGSREEGKGREGKGEERKGRDQGAGRRVKGGRQEELPVIPAPPPKPPTRIGALHAFFLEERTGRLTDPPPYGVGLSHAEPDEEPNWALSGATLSKWISVLPAGLTDAEQDSMIRAMIGAWLEEPYWAAPVNKQTGERSTPYPWGALLSEKQWRKAFLTALPALAEATH